MQKIYIVHIKYAWGGGGGLKWGRCVRYVYVGPGSFINLPHSQPELIYLKARPIGAEKS
jgi:hypothetical protein